MDAPGRPEIVADYGRWLAQLQFRGEGYRDGSIRDQASWRMKKEAMPAEPPKTAALGPSLHHKYRLSTPRSQGLDDPLTLGQFVDFLPIGRGYKSLRQLIRFYAGDELDCDVRLTLKAGEVPGCRLGAAPRLGWSSWLRKKPFAEDDSQVRLRVGG
jgi:hypothetical protein